MTELDWKSGEWRRIRRVRSMAGHSDTQDSLDLREHDGGRADVIRQTAGLSTYFDVSSPASEQADQGTEHRNTRSPALTRMIEAEIIPRLLLSHRHSAVTHPAGGHAHTVHWGGRGDLAFREDMGSTIGEDSITDFARILVKESESSAWCYIQDLCAQGVPPERIFIDVLTPVARRLGVGWEDDLYDFAEVTIGLCRLHEIMRRIGFAYSHGTSTFDYGSNIVLCAIDERHLFGIQMVGEFFRRAGWNVWPEIILSTDEAVDLVSSEHFDVIGFTASCDATLSAIESAIGNVRQLSTNPGIRVLVGGNAFLKDPTAVSRVGADTSAEDGVQAVTRAEALLGRAVRTN